MQPGEINLGLIAPPDDDPSQASPGKFDAIENREQNRQSIKSEVYQRKQVNLGLIVQDNETQTNKSSERKSAGHHNYDLPIG